MFKLVPLCLIALQLINHIESQSVSASLFPYLDEWTQRVSIALDHVLMTEQCQQDMSRFVNGTIEGNQWALKMFDAIGKPSSGLMEASLSFLGNYDQCVQARAPQAIGSPAFEGQYCLANVLLSKAAQADLKRLTGLSDSTVAAAVPRIGLCLPSTCSLSEGQLLANRVLSQWIANSSLTIASCYQEKSNFANDTAAKVALGCFAVLMLPILIGTFYDLMRKSRDANSNDILIAVQHRPRGPTVSSVASLCSSENGQSIRTWRLKMAQFFIACSMKSNAEKILNTEDNANSISVLHGLRVLMMMWIIGGHSYSFAMQWLVFQNPVKMQNAPKSIMSQLIANGTFSVDSFFFISGLLVSLIGLKGLRRSRGQFNFVFYYLHRYIRMTPLMMALIAFCATLLRYMGSGPNWQDSIQMYDGWCRSNWWINALYLHNFINRGTMCLSHSWYSAVDMQLYIIAPIILLPLYHRPRVGMFIIGLFSAVSMIVTGVLTYVHHLPAVPYITDKVPLDVMNDYYGEIYVKPYTRIGPYLVGMALGYIMFTLDGKIRLSTAATRIGWVIAAVLNLGILFAMAPANAGYLPSDSVAALYSATARTLYAVSLAWVTYACAAGKGGWMTSLLSFKFWLPLSRLTYSAYLIHPVVMAWFYGSRQITFEFSHSFMLYMIFGNLFLTYLLSFVMSMLFESPIVGLEKLFMRRVNMRTRV